jgi:hypothetical protein
MASQEEDSLYSVPTTRIICAYLALYSMPTTRVDQGWRLKFGECAGCIILLHFVHAQLEVYMARAPFLQLRMYNLILISRL